MFKDLLKNYDNLKVNAIDLAIVSVMKTNELFDEYSLEEQEILFDFIKFVWLESCFDFIQVIEAVADCLERDRIDIETINDDLYSAKDIVEDSYCY